MTKIIPIQIGYVNVFLIIDQSIILVDTGINYKKDKLESKLNDLGYGFNDISLIICTHNHNDHTGGLRDIITHFPIPFMCHQSESEQYTFGRSAEVVGNKPFTKRFFKILTPLISKRQLSGITPDYIVNEEYDLSIFGADGKVIHTPGHTHGSLSVIIDDEAIIGDIVTSFPFTKPSIFSIGNDRNEMVYSLEKIKDYGINRFYLSHGKMIDRVIVNDLINEFKKVRDYDANK